MAPVGDQQDALTTTALQGGQFFFNCQHYSCNVLKWKLYQSELWQVPGRTEKRKNIEK